MYLLQGNYVRQYIQRHTHYFGHVYNRRGRVHARLSSVLAFEYASHFNDVRMAHLV